MVSPEIQEQRMNGAKGIIGTANTFAIEAGIKIDEYIWNKKQGIDNRENHKLELIKDDKIVSCEFSVEELEDCPGRAGTENTDQKIRKMVTKLQET